MTFPPRLFDRSASNKPPHNDSPAASCRLWGAGSPLRLPWALLLGGCLLIAAMLAGPPMAVASPGLCVGPVCADEIARSAKHHWQLRLRLADQAGQRERITIDCRDGRLSPALGRIDRAYASALARKACRL